MATKRALVWLKSTDLRLADNPALYAAHSECAFVTHLYVFDPFWFGRTARGFPRFSYHKTKFLLESVADLRKNFKERGSTLIVRCGRTADVVQRVASAVSATAVYTQEDVCDEELRIGAEVSAALTALPGRPAFHRVWGGTMYGLADLPFRVKPSSGGPSELPGVFSNFRRKVEDKCKVAAPLPIPKLKPSVAPTADGSATLAVPPFPLSVPGLAATGANVGEGLLPSLWSLGAQDLAPVYRAMGVSAPPADAVGIWEAAVPPALESGTLTDEQALALPSHADSRAVLAFRGGETAALARVKAYIWDEDRLHTYKETRNGMLGGGYSSKFSPWLAYGCLSPRTVVAEVARYERERVANDSTYWLLFELIWRDYFKFYALAYGSALFHLWGPRNVVKADKDWKTDSAFVAAWGLGATGYPFVDANMRELLCTGFQSNRGRQNVASFLTKDLDIDWRFGAEWFECLLIDHDPASNYGNWTYVAGVGADPREDRYFLIPKQSRDYDREGAYMLHWLPELAASGVRVEALHDPHKSMPSGLVRGAGAVYPPILTQLMAHRQGHERGGGSGGNGRGGSSGSRGGRGGSASAHEAASGPQVVAEAEGSGHGSGSGGSGRGRYSKGNGTHPKHGRVQHLS